MAGIIHQPHGAWVLQVARNLLDADDGFLAGKRYLLMDVIPCTRPPSVSFCALRTAVQEYVAHYHTERNHQGLESQLIEPTANAVGAGPIICRERGGGLLHFYPRQAP